MWGGRGVFERSRVSLLTLFRPGAPAARGVGASSPPPVRRALRAVRRTQTAVRRRMVLEPWLRGGSLLHTAAMKPRLSRPTPNARADGPAGSAVPSSAPEAEPNRDVPVSPTSGAAPGRDFPYPRWWVVLAIWAGWGLVLATQVDVYVRMGGKPMPFLTAFRLNMPGALVWALFTPGIIWLGRRFPPFEGPRCRRGRGISRGAGRAPEPALDPRHAAERQATPRRGNDGVRMVVPVGRPLVLGRPRRGLRRPDRKST